MYDRNAMGDKLQYLNELQRLFAVESSAQRDNVADRMQKVCDSIEKDLELSKGVNVGDLTIRLSVDTSAFKEQLKKIGVICEGLKLPKLVQGGIVESSQLYTIGECGPETIIPLDKLGDYISGADLSDKPDYPLNTMVLTFTEHPALVFVKEQGHKHPKIYQDGKLLKGVRSITIRAELDGITTHEIEYVTGRTAIESKDS